MHLVNSLIVSTRQRPDTLGSITLPNEVTNVNKILIIFKTDHKSLRHLSMTRHPTWYDPKSRIVKWQPEGETAK